MKLLRWDACLHIKLMEKVKILHELKSILGTLVLPQKSDH